MTTNHPAHGPVSLDRLHQIREILSKAAAQSDGGNLGYAMADAVKVIDGAIAAFDAEPVIVVGDDGADALSYRRLIQSFAPGTKLYAAPSAPVVPTFDEWLEIRSNKPLGWVKDAMRESYDACRTAMLQAGNSPVAPDGWIPVSERMPSDGDIVLVVDDGYFVCEAQHRSGNFYSTVRGRDDFFETECRDVAHWMPLPAAPQQEDN
ncbi:MAG: DUF551 domain-containing protein [Hafnia sp.]